MAWLLQPLAVGVILLLLGFVGNRFLLPKLREWRRGRRLRRGASAQLELAIAYLTHLRDGVMPAVWRVKARPDEVRDQVRTTILEPIRGYVATEPGEHIKVVWFRPDDDGQTLRMYVQVGHSPEGQEAMRLPIGAGAAGTAFATGETVYCRDCQTDPLFARVPHGHNQGSIVCVPIRRAGEITGVLSVWSTWKDRFWITERLYFEALAAAIASLEVFEETSEVE